MVVVAPQHYQAWLTATPATAPDYLRPGPAKRLLAQVP
jgi:putative SOS response-associated peptidase YedK